MNQRTQASVSPRSTIGSRRRRHARLAIGLGLVLATVACTSPPPTTRPTPPPGFVCSPIDFDRVAVGEKASPDGTTRFELTVSGSQPSVSHTVYLLPATYIRQPDYWAIDIVSCSPRDSLGLGAFGLYTVTVDLTGVVGTKGVAVVGNTLTEKANVPPTSPASSPLTGTSWRLYSLGVPIPAGRTITATFSETTVSGTAGCNTYHAPYTTSDRRVTIGAIVTTEIACEPAVADAESAYLRTLAGATDFSAASRQLILTGPQGQLAFSQLDNPDR